LTKAFLLQVIEECLHEEDEEYEELSHAHSDSEVERVNVDTLVEGCERGDKDNEEDNEDEVEDDASSRTLLMPLCRSSSAPLSTSTDASSSMSSLETVLEVVHDSPSEPSFEPMSLEDNKLSSQRDGKLFNKAMVNQRLVASFDEFEFDDDDYEEAEEEEDKVISYLPAKKVAEADSAASVSSSDSSRSSTTAAELRQPRFKRPHLNSEEDDEEEDTESISGRNLLSEVSSRLRAIKMFDQDAISDESGYSEESSGLLHARTMSGQTETDKSRSGVLVADSLAHHHPPRQLAIVAGRTTRTSSSSDDDDDQREDGDVNGDLTVQSAMQKSLAQSCLTEFCINI
jgi:hypothetical protein